ncbi:MAG: response regulator [Alphaproteobacteria bacterium]|jgi:two-component system OmpR family response regulator|nr:response regulator [Alphaproteobacteria bacterium]MCB1551624.1 response regulator [Alphaproteobacteria bacterium]MCB9984108.1 response regulator [Micavibrio sp.]HRK96957.1 response regulator [Alphaproteobacteria bacterium]
MTDLPLIKILHVDDDPVMRMMTKTALIRSNLGFIVESCASGKEALDKMAVFSPDILLIDMLMPIMDGVSFLKEVRTSENLSCAHVPAFFITGKEAIKISDRNDLEPVIGIIGKPFSPTKLGQDLLDIWHKFQEK